MSEAICQNLQSKFNKSKEKGERTSGINLEEEHLEASDSC
jgi:hypothetical protein